MALDMMNSLDNDDSFVNFTAVFPSCVEEELCHAYGTELWMKMKHRLVVPPLYTSLRVNTMQTSRLDALELLNNALKPFNDSISKQLNRSIIKPYLHPILPDVIIVPSVPPVHSSPFIEPNALYKTVIVDRLCGEAVLRGSDIYVRGIMSTSADLVQNDLVNVYIDLEHKTTRGTPLDQHQGRKLFAAYGRCCLNRGQIFHQVRGLAITDLIRVFGDAPSFNNVLPGIIYNQNLPCIYVAHILAPEPGNVIMDMCAAPGGKTSHIATLMKNQGLLIACDRSRQKALGLQKLFHANGTFPFSIVVPLKLDSTQSVLPRNDTHWQSVLSIVEEARKKQVNSESLLSIKGFYPESFDKILLDPPCSALGLRPRLAHDVDSNGLEEYVSIQKNLLWAAVYLLKVGGTLVYSTCTINPRENEQMVKYALETYPLELVPIDSKFYCGENGLKNQGLSLEECEMVQRFDPTNDKLDTMGFFCAKFTKRTSIHDQNSLK